MKKFLLAIIMSIVTLFATAQKPQSYYASTLSIGTFNDYSKVYDWKDYNVDPIKIYIRDNVILVFDEARSSYKTSALVDRITNTDRTTFTWRAKDEQDRNCYIMIIIFDNGEKTLSILYNDKGYIYILKE